MPDTPLPLARELAESITDLVDSDGFSCIGTTRLIDARLRPLQEQRDGLVRALKTSDKLIRYLAPNSPCVEINAAALKAAGEA